MSQIDIVQSSRDRNCLIAYQGQRTLGYVRKCIGGQYQASYTMRTEGPLRATAQLAAEDLLSYKDRQKRLFERTNQDMLNQLTSAATVVYGQPAQPFEERQLMGRPAPTQIKSASGLMLSID